MNDDRLNSLEIAEPENPTVVRCCAEKDLKKIANSEFSTRSTLCYNLYGIIVRIRL